jgi:chemotaxis protein histidine kinase CheA
VSYDPDEMMLELFRAEVESHSDTLTQGLLKLEQTPDASTVFDGMIRVDPAVEVSHVMEDCFVAAQRGDLVLEPSSIDVLLRSVDLLVQISEASKNRNVDWSHFDEIIRTSVEQLRCVLNKQPIPTSVNTPTEATQPSPSSPLPAAQPETEAAVAKPELNSDAPVGVDVKASSPSTSLASKAQTPIVGLPPAPSQLVAMPHFLGTDDAERIRLELLSRWEAGGSVELDFALMKDLDAIGLAWLHSAVAYAKKHAKRIAATNVTTELKPILELVGIQDLEGP